jgi:hypothetical protein
VGRTLVANRRLAGSACGKRRCGRPLNSVVMRRRAFVVAFGVALPLAAEARCFPEACYAITFDTRTCAHEADHAADFHGVLLKVRPTAVRAVPCRPDGAIGPSRIPDVVGVTEYRYALQATNICKAFEGRAVTLLLDKKCCDTLPPTGWCKFKENVLRDLPPWAQGRYDGWEAPK